MLRTPVNTVAAGRTDAGVHALGQVLSTPDAPEDTDLVRLRDALNGILKPHIAVLGCREVAQDWHARFSARSRLYVYGILASDVPDPFVAGTTLWVRDALDVDAMNESAGHLVGEHDFRSFGRVESGQAPERTLYELKATRAGHLIRVRARANAFIQQMVRSLVGTLLEVGSGRRRPEDVVGILAARDRAAAGPVAPPHGLCLVSVEYDEGWSRPFDPSA